MKIYVYNFADLTLIDCLDTCNNPQGLCALNPDTNVAVLAIPHTEKGHVKVRNFSQDKQGETTIPTHQGSIAAMALNRNGELLATASEKGTLVRVWNTTKAKAVCIFRRGADKAEIRDLQFSKNNTFMSVSSDHATIHLFKIDLTNAEAIGNAQDAEGVLEEEGKEENQKG